MNIVFIIFVVFIIFCIYLYLLFTDKCVNQDQGNKHKIDSYYYETCIGTVRSKDKTYNQYLKRPEYAVSVILDDGYGKIFNDYALYMSVYPGQRVYADVKTFYNENNEVVDKILLNVKC